MSADNKRVPSEEEVAAYKFFGKADNKMKAGMLKPAIRPPHPRRPSAFRPFPVRWARKQIPRMGRAQTRHDLQRDQRLDILRHLAGHHDRVDHRRDRPVEKSRRASASVILEARASHHRKTTPFSRFTGRVAAIEIRCGSD